MKITDFKKTIENQIVRLEATLIWEDNKKAPFHLYFETDIQFQKIFNLDQNGLFLACYLPAWHFGEKRFSIEGSLCPWLCKNNIDSVIGILSTWFPEFDKPPVIEPNNGFEVKPNGDQKALSFLSCGIDSLATLRYNRLLLPPESPASIHSSIAIVFESKKTKIENTPHSSNDIYKTLKSAKKVTEDVGVKLMPLRTNILDLDDGYFFSYIWHGAVLSGIGHLFSQGYNKSYIASSYASKYYAVDKEPWGSHPLLDPNFSSAHFQVEHHGGNMSRYEKICLVANWPSGLQNIIVCQKNLSNNTNCGTCEKCIKTMTSLVSLGKLKECSAFPSNDVSAKRLKFLRDYEMYLGDYQDAFFRTLIPGLKSQGRDDLIDEVHNFLKWHKEYSASGKKSRWI